MKFWIMNWLLNPLVRAILRSRVHILLSRSFAVVTYTGRKSGRRYSVPVMYAERDSDLIVFAGRPSEKTWWRNLRTSAPVRVVVRGQRLTGQAQAILGDEAAIGSAWAAYARKFPKAATARRSGDDAVFVRITLCDKDS